MRILITGAAGAGTSTVGASLATTLDANFQEADEIYWLDTDPPFQAKRPPDERLRMMLANFDQHPHLVVSGSIMNWGAAVEDAFDLIVFLHTSASIRIERIRQRDIELFGRVNSEFLAWAAQYESGDMPGRSLARHNAWLDQRRCAVLRLESSAKPLDLVQRIIGELNVRQSVTIDRKSK